MNDFIANINDFSLEEYNHFYSLMSDSRKKKVDHIKSDEGKKRTLAGEILVKRYYGEDSVIELSDSKKPFLLNKKGEFSVSHCGKYVAVAVSKTPVGIDIEQIRDVNLKITKRICSEKENLYIFGKIPDEEDFLKKDRETLVRFFEIWTFKEAYYKCFKDVKFIDIDIDYFDCSVKRVKKFKENHLIHIVEGDFC